ncbi:MAG: hypothetical protein ACRCWY_11455 [Cellulosilyticaceae bacterium]
MQVTPTHLLTDGEKKDIGDLLAELKRLQLIDQTMTIDKYIENSDAMTLASLKRIPYIPKNQPTLDGFKKHNAGERPGIVVGFEAPKLVNATAGQIEECEGVTAELQLVPQYLDVNTPYRMEFQMKENANIRPTGDHTGQKGEVVKNLSNNQLEVYISSQKVRDVEHVWEGLKDGMIVKSTLTLKGGVFNSIKGTQTSTALTGHTYIKYDILKTSADQITFDIKPYPIKDTTLKYSIYNRENTVPLQTNTYKNMYERILMTVDKGTGLEYYHVGVNIGNVNYQYRSQIVECNLDNQAIAPYSEIISVEKAYVIPNENDPTSGEAEAVGVNITWQAPADKALHDLLDKGPLYYELFINEGSQLEEFDEIVKVFKVYKEDNVIKMIDHKDSKDPTKPKSEVILSYSKEDKLFRAEGIVLKKRKELIADEREKYNWENLEMPDKYLSEETYPHFGVGDKEIKEKSGLDYTIPNIFYFKMRTVYEIDKELVNSSKSKAKPLAIDISGNIIPAPEDLKAVDASANKDYKGEISFTGVDLEPYIRYMFDPIGIKLTDPNAAGYTELEARNRRNYEVYIYQDQNLTYKDFGNAIPLPNKKGDKIDFKQPMKSTAAKTYIEELRDGGIIRIDAERYGNKDKDTGKKEEIKLLVEGLDPNTPYYVVVRVRVERFKEGKVLENMYSLYTEYVTFTTDTNSLPPIPEDKVPSAPTEFWAVGPRNEDEKVYVHWTESEFEKYKEGDIYYELVRTTDAGLGEWDDPDKSAAEIAKAPKKAQVYEIDKKKESIRWYNTVVNGFQDLNPKQSTAVGEQTLPDSNESVAAFTYTDTDMFPNTIYYYYVRTVHKVDGKELRSEFIMVPVTTDPIDKPIELKVERPKVDDDKTTDQVIISFWAPVPASGVLGTDYDFEIDIKGEKDPKYYTANKFEDNREYEAKYQEKKPIDERYIKFTYKITGLKHSTSYDVRVRIVDKTKPKDAYSAYSDKVRFRTDFDEDEQDKEDKYKEYLEQYDRETEKLKNNPYWLSDSTGARGIFKYRQAYLGGLLGGNGTYSLETLEFERDVYYYFPASMAKLIQKNNKMLQVELEDFSAYVRANTFLNNAEIREADQYVKEKDIKDYYIGMSFIQSPSKQTIQGNKTVTPEITINMEIIYSDTEDFVVEEDIMIALLELIAKGRERLIKVLDNEMDRGTFREEKVKGFIEDEIKWIQDEHQYEVKRILRAINDGSEELGVIQAPMLIVAKTEETAVEAYYAASTWEKQYAFQTMGGYGVEASRLGTYVFTGRKGVSITVPNIPGAESLIQKYYLADFFTFDQYGLQQYVTKQQFYGTMARMIGAKRDADPVLALQNRGIQLVMPQNIYQTMRMDETLYVVMQSYEKMYYKPISSIVIQNNNKVSNIMAFQPAYRPYIQAAVQLKVVDTASGRILPTEALTTEKLLKMLVKIMPN